MIFMPFNSISKIDLYTGYCCRCIIDNSNKKIYNKLIISVDKKRKNDAIYEEQLNDTN